MVVPMGGRLGVMPVIGVAFDGVGALRQVDPFRAAGIRRPELPPPGRFKRHAHAEEHPGIRQGRDLPRPRIIGFRGPTRFHHHTDADPFAADPLDEEAQRFDADLYPDRLLAGHGIDRPQAA
ncbi:MAG TPA: hypothetical protein VK973_14625 [Arenicellales bacterium]|nr:hypothetical protein [Arenicellales bacterium]